LLGSNEFISKYINIVIDLKESVSFQGDVGCGKTVVAFLACMEVIGAGYQVGNMKLSLFFLQNRINGIFQSGYAVSQ